jgi:hypothetical protein
VKGLKNMGQMTDQVSLSNLPLWIANRFEGIGKDTNVKLPYCESARRLPVNDVRITFGDRHQELIDDFITINYVINREWEIPRPFISAVHFLGSIPDEMQAQRWEANERGDQQASTA